MKKIQMTDRYGKKDDNVQKRNHHDKKRKERKCSLKYRFALNTPLIRASLPGKVSLCASCRKIRAKLKKASLTVETALVLPLFFFGMVTMISFMDIYKVQTEHLTLLCQRAKEAGMYAYVADGNGLEEIVLPDVYSYQPVGGIIPLPKVWTFNTVKVHTWTGTEHRSGNFENEETEVMVYVTESGKVYHRSLSCSYLNLSVTEVSGSTVSSRRNAYGEKYHACESCSLHQSPASMVYITEKGNRYHNKKTCSGLKRSVRLVKESELSGMHACSRCG